MSEPEKCCLGFERRLIGEAKRNARFMFTLLTTLDVEPSGTVMNL